jgi:magnesium transporter
MVQWKEVLSTDLQTLQVLASQYQVHPLALEDCLHRDQRAKLEDYGNHQFLVWFMYAEGKIHEMQFLIFPDLVILVPHEPPPKATSWKEFLKVNEDAKDFPHFIYSVLDRMTDITRAESGQLFKRIQDFEQKLFQGNSQIQTILPIRKKLSSLELQMGHLPSVAQQLQNFFHPKDDLAWKFRDLRDHCERLYQSVIFHEGQITGSFELYWAVAAQKTNIQMKKLTLLASIAVPLTFWASFFGMNFQSIPYQDPVFFASCMTVMFGSVIGTYFFLKYKGYWNND